MPAFNRNWIAIDCPRCGYNFEIMLISIQMEETCYCHNCKVGINLVDQNADTSKSVKQVDDLFKQLKNLFN